MRRSANADDSRTLRTGGYLTVTTKERIEQFGARRIFGKCETRSREGGDWFVLARPNPKDPKPAHSHREIPKPYHFSDPGPEPVKDPAGCIAGTTEDYSYARIEWLFGDLLPGDWVVGPASHGGVQVERWSNGTLRYTEERQWGGPTSEVKQCPHCAAFERLHSRWAERYYGYGRHGCGWAKHEAMLADHGSRESWQAAYLADFRRVRAARKAMREWEQRNHIPFYERMTMDADGYPTQDEVTNHLAYLKAEARQEKVRARARAERDRIVKRKQRERDERRRVMSLVAQALAGSIFAESERLRGECFIKPTNRLEMSRNVAHCN